MAQDPTEMTRRHALRLAAGAAAAVGTAAGLLGACSRGSGRGTTAAPSATAVPPTSTKPGTPSKPSTPDWARLGAALAGRLLRPGQAGYAGAARLYNPRFDSSVHPAAIARCANADDVVACVRSAAATPEVPFALRSGGHSYGGWSTSAGLVIDVSGMTSVSVDTAGATARIDAGAPLAHVYAALAAKGVALAAGSCPTVGITGLTLGGGVGVLSRAFGLTCDALRSVEIVTADGRRRMVDASTDADLFWALRGGGGGGFGAVTAFTMAVRPAPTVHTFYYEWGFDRAADVLDAWQHWVAGVDNRAWSTCKLLATPGDGSARATISGTWIGPAAGLDGVLAPLLSKLGRPPVDARSTMSYGDAMAFEAGCSGRDADSCTSAAMAPLKRQAFAATSSIVAQQLPTSAVEAAVARTRAALNLSGAIEAGVSFDVLGGAVAGVAPEASAFPHRRALATVQYTATWRSGSAAPFDAYVRGFRSAMRPWLGDAAYVNYADASIVDFGHAYWGDNYPRLQMVKRAVDPDDLFSFPQSPRP